MFKYLFYSLRPKQWIKNVFIFLPLVFAGKLFSFTHDLKAAAAFVLFSMTSSSVYLINDVIDLPKDRLHPLKKLRPIASGKVKTNKAMVAAGVLALVAVPLSFILAGRLGVVVLSYFVLNLFYSRLIKNTVILDVMCIAAFFVLRVLAGAYAIDVPVSVWLVICAALLALFLGFSKRRHELKVLEARAREHRDVLEHYSTYFLDQMISIITTSTLIAYFLYTISDNAVMKFGTRNLVFTVPFALYGIFRYLYLVHQKRLGGDPARVILADPPMMANIFLWFVTTVMIIYFF